MLHYNILLLWLIDLRIMSGMFKKWADMLQMLSIYVWFWCFILFAIFHIPFHNILRRVITLPTYRRLVYKALVSEWTLHSTVKYTQVCNKAASTASIWCLILDSIEIMFHIRHSRHMNFWHCIYSYSASSYK